MNERLDPLLAGLVDMAEHGGLSLGVTLHFHGIVVSGTLVSAAEHMQGIRDQLRSAGPNSRRFADELESTYTILLRPIPPDESIIEESPFVHLRDATIWSGGATRKALWWAGHLWAIDGWTLGTL